MINFYRLSESLRLALVLLIGISVFTQTIAFLLSIYRKVYNELYLLIDVFEVMILGSLMVMGLILGQALNAYDISMIPAMSYLELRKTLFYLILFLSLILTFKTKKPIYLLGLLGSLILLPRIEILSQKSYLALYTLSVLILFLRSLLICKNSIWHIRTKVSALSIVQAINTLDSGTLYSKSNGRIVLINDQMQNLMILLSGRMYRNANDFYNLVTLESENNNLYLNGLRVENICLMPDGRAWLFKRQKISLLNKIYTHISATDVSNAWNLTQMLKKQNIELQEKSENLKKTIENLYEISQSTKIDNIQNQVHDVLGQHISYMLKLIKEDKPLDFQQLKNLSEGLIAEIWIDEATIEPLIEIENLIQVFSTIGVSIIFKNDYPKDEKILSLLFDVVREATTNAVRHGFATEITVVNKKSENDYLFTISNNGHLPKGKIIFGEGLSEIKNKVRSVGGKLRIKQSPKFIIEICIPGGDINEEGFNS